MAGEFIKYHCNGWEWSLTMGGEFNKYHSKPKFFPRISLRSVCLRRSNCFVQDLFFWFMDQLMEELEVGVPVASL
jgi:hypothetical protein